MAQKIVFFVLGTRPEAIKLAPLISELRKDEELTVTLCAFRQHGRMLDEALAAFDLTPDFDFGIALGDSGLLNPSRNPLKKLFDAARTGWGLLRFFLLLKRTRPSLLVVHGDTSTAFLAAFFAFHFKILVAHVEAGLRTGNKYAPFPEEMNRRLVAVLADLHFSPTEAARENLIREGVSPSKIFVTGNTELDALRMILEMHKDPARKAKVEKALAAALGSEAEGKKLILVTAHRRESFGEGLENICAALLALAKKRSDILIVYPVHPNPHVRKVVFSRLGNVSGVRLIEALPYETFAAAMQRAYLILTDSGGIQEAVSFLGKPTLVMREFTERGEGLLAGTTRLVGTDAQKIVEETERLLDDPAHYERMARPHASFGDGFAAQKIALEARKYIS